MNNNAGNETSDKAAAMVQHCMTAKQWRISSLRATSCPRNRLLASSRVCKRKQQILYVKFYAIKLFTCCLTHLFFEFVWIVGVA